MLLFSLALRNATRNVTRTALTAITVLLGTALLTVTMAWLGGVFGSMLETAASQTGHVRISQSAYIDREEMLPLYENVEVDPTITALEGVEGVVEVVPRISTGVTITASEEIGDYFALAIGSPPGWMTGRLGLTNSFVEGGPITKDEGQLVLGGTLAKRLGAKIGDEIVMLGQTQDGALSPVKGELVGIVSAGTGLIDQAVFMNLPEMQYLADMDGYATELVVYTDDRDDARALAERLRKLPLLAESEGALVAQAWDEREPWVAFLPVVNAVLFVIQAVIVFITALGVWNTMMMSVLERTGEIGVMRAMGLTKGGAISMFVVEALAIALFGGLGGVLLGGAAGTYLEVYGVELGDQLTANLSNEFPLQTTLYADMNAEVALWAFALGLLMAVLGSALPASRAAGIQPVEAMRARR